MESSVCLEEFNKYLTNVKKASANTLASYLRDVRQLDDYLRSHDLSELAEVDDEELEGYITWLRHNGKSPATVSRSIASLKCFYGHMLDLGVVEHNPASGLVPEKSVQRLPQILTS